MIIFDSYFDISCDRFKVISLDNSYLTVEQDIKIHIPKQQGLVFSTYYIGYKYAADCIDQYRIYSNTDLVQTQNHARYEWFMIYNSVSDEAKENSDLYVTLHKIRNRNPMVPGVYVDLAAITDGGGTDITIHLKNRIPLSAFLTLFNLRFFPNWSGKLSIEIYPSYRNLVIAPVIPEVTLTGDEKLLPLHNTYNKCDFTRINIGFRNINQQMLNVIKDGTPYDVTPQTFTFNGDGCKACNCSCC